MATTESARKRRVYFGLGSNLGDRVAQLRAGLDALRAAGVAWEAVSTVYDTPPWGVSDQPRFANIVAVGSCSTDPAELLVLVKHIEAEAGRDFSAARWTARPLDIDLLLVEGEVVDTEVLHIPHERMHERAFVLVPLAEIAPRARHPLFGMTAGALLDELPESERNGVTVLEAAGWYALD